MDLTMMAVHRGVMFFIFVFLCTAVLGSDGKVRRSSGVVLEIEIDPEQEETAPHDGASLGIKYPPNIGTDYSRALTYMEVMTGRVYDAQGLNGFDLYGHSPMNMEDFTVRRISCLPRNASVDQPLYVQIVNSSSLLKKLGDKNDTSGRCVVVLFYAPWCPFCAKVAPYFNAIARAFHQLDVLAIDAIHFSNLNSRFGTIAVPNIIIFHNAKAVARFNNTERTFAAIKDFINNVTNIKPNESVNLEEEDFIGPLLNTPTEDTDYFLILSWVFIVCFMSFQVGKSSLGQRVLSAIQNFGHHEQQAAGL